MSLVTLTSGITTKLDAINYILSAIGSVPVSNEEEIDEDVDAAAASELVDDLNQQIQTNNGKGWWFNREGFHKLVPNPSTGNISVPNNTLSCYLKRSDGQVKSVALRGKQLFDPNDHGYDMRPLVNSVGELPCILVVTIPYEDTPATVRQAVADFGRFWMVSNVEGDNNKMQPLKQAAEASLISVKSEDASQRRRNMYDNSGISYAVAKAGGYNNV